MPEGTHGGVVQYDLGKITQEGFVTKGFLWPPPTELRNAVEHIPSDQLVDDNKISEYIDVITETWPLLSIYQKPSEHDILYHPHRDEQGHWFVKERMPRPFEGPRIHYGLVASAVSVVKDASKRDAIIKSVGDILCFEMEAAGWMSESPCMVIRGISDYGDVHKNGGWHHYAAATAAAFTKELLTHLDVPPIAQGSCGLANLPTNQTPMKSAVMRGNGIQNTGSGNVSIGGNFSA